MQNFVHYKNKKIYYQTQGQGDTIVFLHGFLNSSVVWEYYLENLSENYQVIAVDLPGHGESENLAEVHPMDLMADAVCAVLDELLVKKCVMIGHSMGGYVMLNFAGRYSERVAGFGMINSTALPDGETAKENRLRVCEIVKNEKLNFVTSFIPELFAKENLAKFNVEIERLRGVASNISPQAIIAAQHGMINRESFVKFLEAAKNPVLFIGGHYDTRIPVEILLSQAMMVKNAEILLLPTGHMSHIEAHVEACIAIESFVKRCFVFQS